MIPVVTYLNNVLDVIQDTAEPGKVYSIKILLRKKPDIKELPMLQSKIVTGLEERGFKVIDAQLTDSEVVVRATPEKEVSLGATVQFLNSLLFPIVEGIIVTTAVSFFVRALEILALILLIILGIKALFRR